MSSPAASRWRMLKLNMPLVVCRSAVEPPPVKTRLGETPLWVQFCVYSGTPPVKTRLGETPLWVQFCVYSGTLCKKNTSP